MGRGHVDQATKVEVLWVCKRCCTLSRFWIEKSGNTPQRRDEYLCPACREATWSGAA
jgi:hypothetical protein